jgi:hypothetical protein
MYTRFVAVCLLAGVAAGGAAAQTGAGNANAVALAQKSPAVQTAYNYLITQARSIDNEKLRFQTLDAISNAATCVKHRAGVSPAKQQQILQQLEQAGLVDPNTTRRSRAAYWQVCFQPS